jgi:hypothetical protein
MIRAQKEVNYDAVSRNSLSVKIRKVPENHYQINGKVYGHWADDWLNDWQTKNEG